MADSGSDIANKGRARCGFGGKSCLMLDACGLLCPLPVLKARQYLSKMAAGEVLTLLCDDPASRIDVAHFCTQQGHRLRKAEDAGAHFIFQIEKC